MRGGGSGGLLPCNLIHFPCSIQWCMRFSGAGSFLALKRRRFPFEKMFAYLFLSQVEFHMLVIELQRSQHHHSSPNFTQNPNSVSYNGSDCNRRHFSRGFEIQRVKNKTRGDPDSYQRIGVSKAGAQFQACAAEVVAVLAL